MSNETNNAYDVPSTVPPRKLIPPFESLRAFDAVARLGGVRKAAQALYRDHAVVSRHLRALENWTGCQLIERTPAGAVLTTEGEIYHRKIRQAIDQIADATVGIVRRNQEQSLQLWCMPGFALHWLIRFVDSFEDLYPDIELQLRSTHELPDFSRQEADVDIRMLLDSQRPDTNDKQIQCEKIATPPVIAVASSDYLQQHAPIEKPADLLGHQLLHEEDFDNWQMWLRACDIDALDELSGSRLWDGHMTLAAARRGRGVALTNPLVASEDLERRKLIHIGRDSAAFRRVTLWNYWFIARRDQWGSGPVAFFREWLMKTVEQELERQKTVAYRAPV